MVRKEAMEHMGAAYMSHGIITLAGSRLYTSMADTDEIIDEALNRFDDVFSLVKARTKVDTLQVAEYKERKAMQYPEGPKRDKKLKKARKLMERARRNRR